MGISTENLAILAASVCEIHAKSTNNGAKVNQYESLIDLVYNAVYMSYKFLQTCPSCKSQSYNFYSNKQSHAQSYKVYSYKQYQTQSYKVYSNKQCHTQSHNFYSNKQYKQFHAQSYNFYSNK